MVDHIHNRDRTIEALHAELVGPSPQGKPIDCSRALRFDTAESSYGPWQQEGSGEEILDRDGPCIRYGVGVLYPLETPAEDFAPASADGTADNPFPVEPSLDAADAALTDQARKDLDAISERSAGSPDADDDEFDFFTANTFRPSSMGLSFLTDLPSDGTLVVHATGGRYRRTTVLVAGKERTWWLRSPVSLRAEFPARLVRTIRGSRLQSQRLDEANTAGLDLLIELYSRPHGDSNWLITASLINRTHVASLPDDCCLFQTGFVTTVEAADGDAHILPYPGPPHQQLDDEERSLELLYRHAQTFAVGHGCAADWTTTDHARAAEVRATCLPRFETPSITPELCRPDGSVLEVPMAPLAGLIDGDDGMQAVVEVVERYADWIADRRGEIPSLDEQYRDAANRHLDTCERSLERMRDGLAYLRGDQQARQAFQLANHAILLQQIRSGREPRRLIYRPAKGTKSAGTLVFSEPYSEPDPRKPGGRRGNWRPFQLAFLLASLRSVARGDVPERMTVELIWFPTGGGKTEAYLGLTAFAIFLRRLQNPADTGVHVLMRYTLRLLTAQQFQRASGLFCAMEYLRSLNPVALGTAEFAIGIWLGGATTPNTRADALSILRGLIRGDRYTENQFLVTRCPWCRAQIGPIDLPPKAPSGVSRVIGYDQDGPTVRLRCSDSTCRYSSGLPIYVIDEDIYDKRPSLVIGTVDKFAMLAWRPEAHALFGLDPAGKRIASPPGLIIQDELHLISGPLGSMVGLYETIIEELCTDRRRSPAIAPKIVSSTATIRRYQAQIRALYGRGDVALFPPPGLDAGDSFFARYDRDEQGRLKRGRLYVGVHAPGLGSLQTAQVRTFASLLQTPVTLTPPERDPWWTLLVFFNSLRELGAAVSLFQSDIPDYFRVMRNRTGSAWQPRYINHLLELTGRLRSDAVPAAITALEVETTTAGDRQYPVDVCLASNIIEVGVDIDRLSLMAVVGQPKTTSQYIQVTGRVGRRPDERPGLIVTLYSAAKPRDRSHFEKFRSYHERLYAQVEPTSVTPFSPPALERALHATMAGYVRQLGPPEVAKSPYPFPQELVERCHALMVERVRAVDPDEEANLERTFARRVNEWQRWERTAWRRNAQQADALLWEAGSYRSAEEASVSWSTPMSMRNVDAECQAEITLLYANDRSDENA